MRTYVTVDNLAGTAIRQADIDLSASTGGGDHQADAVAVNGTNQADNVDVTASDGQIDVAGLPAETRITGSDTIDHLQIKTLDGNDKVTVDPDASALIGVGVDLGPGQA
jgi:hypothetical protein